MIQLEDIPSLRAQVRRWKQDRLTIGLIPTMGYFHEGHLALMRHVAQLCDKTVATIFVNPRQFGPQEDLTNYPRDLQRDAELAGNNGVHLLFSPSPDDIYPQDYQTDVTVKNLSQGLCGTSRPGHFVGVATVVSKLFNLVQPDIAVFGQKDYQQLAVLKRLVMDLNFPVEIISHPIVREADGLAMSSRNKNLSPQSRQNALCLYKALQYAAQKVGEKKQLPARQIIDELSNRLKPIAECEIDYISIVDPATLKEKDIVQSGDLLALAAYFNNKVRLIDNIIL